MNNQLQYMTLALCAGVLQPQTTMKILRKTDEFPKIPDLQ